MIDLAFSIITTGISCIYVIFYNRSRHIPGFLSGSRKESAGKLIICLIVDLSVLILAGADRNNLGFGLIVIMMLLSGIDILIQRIPTELLALYYLLSVILIYKAAVPPAAILSAMCIGLLFFLLRKKAGIALYDILLIIPLAAQFGTAAQQLKFIAVFLIGWGGAGLCLRLLIKKKRDPVTIPLVPVAVLSFLASMRFVPR